MAKTGEQGHADEGWKALCRQLCELAGRESSVLFRAQSDGDPERFASHGLSEEQAEGWRRKLRDDGDTSSAEALRIPISLPVLTSSDGSVGKAILLFPGTSLPAEDSLALAVSVGDFLAGHANGSRAESNAKWQAMLAVMADGLLMTDVASGELFINAAARRMLEIPDEIEVSRAYLKERLGFYPFDLLATTAPTEDSIHEELRIGDKRLNSVISPIRDAEQKSIGVVVVLREFSDAQNFARQQEQAVARLTHELRSPLTSISGALDVVLGRSSGTLLEEQENYLSIARESCAELNQVVNRIIEEAQNVGDEVSLRLVDVDLSSLASEVVAHYQASAGEKDVELRIHCASASLEIPGDSARLSQVLSNLLTNALKFTPRGGVVDVELFEPSVSSSYVGVSVYNNGESIPPALREEIFERLEDSTNESRRVSGSGLGLAMSRAIIEGHGGRIWVESQGEGVKFVFTLPASRIARKSEDLSGPNATTGGRVLLVDADDHSSYILKGFLIASGHTVQSVADTDECLRLARESDVDAIVLNTCDLGDALLEILKHDSDTRRIPVLALCRPEDATRPAIQRSASASLVMPVEENDFRKECARLLSSGGGSDRRVLVVDDDDAIRTICCAVLRQNGITVEEANRGALAIEKAARFRPNLILMDIMMPEMDGFETASKLKTDPGLAMTPIIFLSAMGATDSKVKAFSLGADDYIVKPFVTAELVARVKKALERADRDLGASPTTQLPGADAIESQVDARLADENAAFCYLDLDNLKAYNDFYSYAKADSIIRQTGNLARDVIAQHGNPDDFIGHIAGDDFVVITSKDRVDAVCKALCNEFDRLVPLYYDKKDRTAGHIETKDRYGEVRQFALMSISVAAITSESGRFDSYADLAEAAAVGKKLAKGTSGSCYYCDGKKILGAD